MQKAAEQKSFSETRSDMSGRRQYAYTLLRRIRSVQSLAQDITILDLGCGTGALATCFSELGCRCIGVEPDDSARRVAAGLAEGAHVPARIVGGAAEALPFRQESFDVVIANSVLEHVLDPNQVTAEVCRVLKPGGIFWFESASAMCPFQHEIEGFPLFGWYPGWLKLKIMRWTLEHRPHWVGGTQKPALHWFTDARAATLLRRHGFDQVYDRWDIRREDEGDRWHARALRAIRSCRTLRGLANACISEYAYLGVKRNAA
jgi:ubiquinone/menaquinone biosynthesis C-methylase UbiE